MTYFGTGLYLDWALRTLLQWSQSTLIRVSVLWLSASELKPCWSKISSIRYHFSQTSFVPDGVSSSVKKQMFLTASESLPCPVRRQQHSQDSLLLRRKLFIGPYKILPRFIRIETRPAVWLLLVWQMAWSSPLNGLPGDAAAELQEEHLPLSACPSYDEDCLTVARCRDTGIYAHKSCISCTLA